MDNTSVSNITSKQKIFAILAYVGIFWFLGMLNLIPSDVRESAYVKNHVNNGMILFICEMFLACIPFVGWALEVVIIVFAVMGIIAAAKTQYFTLPLFLGKFKIVK